MKFVTPDPRKVLKRLEQAEKLLDRDTTSKAKFNALRKLVKGINPTLDKKLSAVSKTLNKIDKVKKGKVVELTVEHLPADTKERKKRKKLLLLLMRRWKGLKSEVKRVKKELSKQSGEPSKSQAVRKASLGGKLVATAKGPLGILTGIAAVIAGGIIYLDTRSVTVTIRNENCQVLQPVGYRIDLPGIKLPTEPIPAGGEATMTLPPLKFAVDASNPGAIRLSALRMNFTFDRTDVGGDILFNGSSLLNRQTEINLGLQKSHFVTIRC